MKYKKIEEGFTMNFELNGMEEMNEQELIMVDGGVSWGHVGAGIVGIGVGIVVIASGGAAALVGGSIYAGIGTGSLIAGIKN